MQWNRQLKNTVREVITDTGYEARTALFLPGPNCLCIREAVSHGVVTRRTRLVVAEHETQHMPAIENYLTSAKFCRPTLHVGPLEYLCLEAALRGEPLDFGFMDFCIPLNSSWLRWVRQELSPCLDVGSRIVFTVRRNYRREPFVPCFRDIVHQHGAYLQKVRDMLAEAPRGGVLNGCRDPFAAGVEQRTSVFHHAGQAISPHFHTTSVEIAAAILLALADMRLVATDCFEYNPDGAHGSRMTTIGFEVKATRPPRWAPGGLRQAFAELLAWGSQAMCGNYHNA